MLRYGFNGVCLKSFQISKIKIKYDDVVDKSSFRKDAENIRDLINSGSSSLKGVYDDDKELPDDVTVKLRSGKFDKAEVSQMILKQQEIVKQSQENDKKQAELDKLQQINNARQEYIDKKTGFTGQVTE